MIQKLWRWKTPIGMQIKSSSMRVRIIEQSLNALLPLLEATASKMGPI